MLSGTSSGKVFLHSLDTGSLQRHFTDHIDSCITSLDYDPSLSHSPELTLGGELWLASSNDRRISVWTSDWKNKVHHLAAWISFPGISSVEARFSKHDTDQLVYWTNTHVSY